jgi:Uma2 family endonuclease
MAVAEGACELWAGWLVEKPMGWRESYVSEELLFWLKTYLKSTQLGFVLGERGAFAFAPNRMYIPDLSFVRFSQCPQGRLPGSLDGIIPALVVEVLSASNTVDEMQQKRAVYFAAGVELVWEVEPELRTVAVYTQPAVPDVVLTRGDELTGGAVLPGFRLRLADWFACLNESAPDAP